MVDTAGNLDFNEVSYCTEIVVINVQIFKKKNKDVF